MRLLDTSTLKPISFVGDTVPPYVILSHTWGDDEISLQELEGGEFKPETAGFKKIKMCCELARRDGFEYAWIDTCCIDKKNSTELSEAINSMYRWYRDAEVCYVFLADVSAGDDLTRTSSSFKTSRWFTRGWTLQELIAPSGVIFYGREWTELGTKASLKTLISDVSSIHLKALEGSSLTSFSVAQKMSWASMRKTTRKEDIAYCLMGLFDVNMPMLYGEGGKAFIRLQEEILRKHNDHTIFAWQDRSFPRGPLNLNSPGIGFLARGPDCFLPKSSNVVTRHDGAAKPINLTGNGIGLDLPMRRITVTDELRSILLASPQEMTKICNAAAGWFELQPAFHQISEMNQVTLNDCTMNLVALDCELDQSPLPSHRICLLIFWSNHRSPGNYRRVNARIPLVLLDAMHLPTFKNRKFSALIYFGDIDTNRPEYTFGLETHITPQQSNLRIYLGRLTSRWSRDITRAVSISPNKLVKIPFTNLNIFKTNAAEFLPFIFIDNSENAFQIYTPWPSADSAPEVGFRALIPGQGSSGSIRVKCHDLTFHYFPKQTPTDGPASDSDVNQKLDESLSDRGSWHWIERQMTVRASLKRRIVSGERWLVLSVHCAADTDPA